MGPDFRGVGNGPVLGAQISCLFLLLNDIFFLLLILKETKRELNGEQYCFLSHY